MIRVGETTKRRAGWARLALEEELVLQRAGVQLATRSDMMLLAMLLKALVRSAPLVAW